MSKTIKRGEARNWVNILVRHKGRDWLMEAVDDLKRREILAESQGEMKDIFFMILMDSFKMEALVKEIVREHKRRNFPIPTNELRDVIKASLSTGRRRRDILKFISSVEQGRYDPVH